MKEINFYKIAAKIDDLLSREFDPYIESKVMEIIAQTPAYEKYFFSKVSNILWFYPLKSKGYFDPTKAPIPEPADKEGYFIIPEWNVLPYLERVSEQVNEPGNERFINELLEIIKKVTTYHIKNNKILDNYRTWYYFVKILLNIPNDKIPLEIIEFIPIWLDSKFDTTLQGSEIATKLLPKFLTGNPEDIKKAEKIIESITTIKTVPLNEESAKFLGKKEEAKLVVDPYWLKKAFEKHSITIGEKCSNKVIDYLAKKVKSLLKREEDGTYRGWNILFLL